MAADPAERVVRATAPIRICDLGGWTDTWFAGHGKVLNIAVTPCVEVEVRVQRRGTSPGHIVLRSENYGDHYAYELGAAPGRHLLLEAVIDEVGLPDDVSVAIRVSSEVPAGASTGTSAAVAVALVSALASISGRQMTAHEVAGTAHRVETERLGRQSGVQDQLCATLGGINYIEISSFPEASVSRPAIPESVWSELEIRLILLYLGRPHTSSEVHERVIERLTRHGEGAAILEDLRRCAEDAMTALSTADFENLGRAMQRNTQAQHRLHPDLVGPQASSAIEVAKAHDVLGWKVNGAGGDGGSLTLLCGTGPGQRPELVRALQCADPSFQVIPIGLSRSGLRIWQS